MNENMAYFLPSFTEEAINEARNEHVLSCILAITGKAAEGNLTKNVLKHRMMRIFTGLKMCCPGPFEKGERYSRSGIEMSRKSFNDIFLKIENSGEIIY